MIAEYVTLERDIMLEQLAAEDAIGRVKKQRDDTIATLHVTGQALFDGLKAWWEAGGNKAVAGRNRSGELAGATIGIRKTPPALKLARKVTAAAIVEWIGSLRLFGKDKYLRQPKTQLDKSALIKAIRDNEPIAAGLEAKGVSIEQVDEFFIDAGIDKDTLQKNAIQP